MSYPRSERRALAAGSAARATATTTAMAAGGRTMKCHRRTPPRNSHLPPCAAGPPRHPVSLDDDTLRFTLRAHAFPASTPRVEGEYGSEMLLRLSNIAEFFFAALFGAA